jgi:hypothetical protein
MENLSMGKRFSDCNIFFKQCITEEESEKFARESRSWSANLFSTVASYDFFLIKKILNKTKENYIQNCEYCLQLFLLENSFRYKRNQGLDSANINYKIVVYGVD